MKPLTTHPQNFVFRVPFHPDVTERQMKRAAELWADFENKESKRDEARAIEFAATLERRTEKLRRAIGAEHFFALQQFKQALQLEASRNRNPVKVTSEFRADLVRNNKRRVKKFLAGRGLSADKVSKAVTQVFEGIPSPFNTAFVGEIADGVLEEPRQTGPNAFKMFTPPYTGHGTGYREGALGFRFEHDNFIDAEVGQVGLAIRLDDRNVREHDWAFMKRSSMVAFWFKAPLTGIVEVITDYQSIQARFKLTVEDLCGFSDAKVTQKHLLSMQVIHPNVSSPTFQLAGQMTYDGDSEVFLNHRHLPGGHKIQTRMTSNGVVNAGEMVLIAVGCRSEDDAESNDMEVHSESIFSWFIPRVFVRTLE
jgi:hypothetical protein